MHARTFLLASLAVASLVAPAMRAADAAGCTGWVRNDPNGTVSMEIQGSEAQIERVIRSLDRAPYIRITDLNVRRIPVDERESDFITKGEYW